MKKGRAGKMTHDYKRHGSTTLFAALNVLDGTVIGRNRSVDDLKATIDRFVVETNADPKPFVWTAKSKTVLAAVKRGKEKFEALHYAPNAGTNSSGVDALNRLRDKLRHQPRRQPRNTS